MYSYNIAAKADSNIFFEVCRKIESTMRLEEKGKLLIDVDGSMIQTYGTTMGEIRVFNDCEVDAVYVDSDVLLEKLIQEV